jgi:hypothetical protein
MAARKNTKKSSILLAGNDLLVEAVHAELRAMQLTTGERFGASMVVKAFTDSKALVWGNRMRATNHAAIGMLSLQRARAAIGRETLDVAGASTGIWQTVKLFKRIHARLSNPLSQRTIALILAGRIDVKSDGRIPGGLLTLLGKEKLYNGSYEQRRRIHYALALATAIIGSAEKA